MLDAARQLGWRRNLLVNGMQTGRTRTVGVMIPPFDSFWVDVLAGIHIVLASADYLPITVWVGDCQEIPHFEKGEDEGFKQISRLLDRRVDGLILWPSFAVAYYDHFRELLERRVPVVVIDHEYSEDQIADSIETDEAASARTVAEHLINLGHARSPACRRAKRPWQAWSVRRRECFEAAVRNWAASRSAAGGSTRGAPTAWKWRARSSPHAAADGRVLRDRPRSPLPVRSGRRAGPLHSRRRVDRRLRRPRLRRHAAPAADDDAAAPRRSAAARPS